MALPPDLDLNVATLRAMLALGRRATTAEIDDRVFELLSPAVRAREFPGLQRRLRAARNDLLEASLIARPIRGAWELTEKGVAAASTAATEASTRLLVQSSTIAEPLLFQRERERIGLPSGENETMPMIIELNLRHPDGLEGALDQFKAIYQKVVERPKSTFEPIADIFLHEKLTLQEAKDLVRADIAKAGDRSEGARTRSPNRAIHRIWPDFPVKPV